MAAFNYCGHTMTIGLLSHSVVAVEDKGSVLQPQKALVRHRLGGSPGASATNQDLATSGKYRKMVPTLLGLL